jgi:hypothetical protein
MMWSVARWIATSWQLDEQPFDADPLAGPLSHCSPFSTTELPHTAAGSPHCMTAAPTPTIIAVDRT